MTRAQQRLLSRFNRAKLAHEFAPTADTERDMQEARAAYLGDAIYRYRPSMTQSAMAVRKYGAYAAAKMMRGLGVSFVDAFVNITGRMPRHG